MKKLLLLVILLPMGIFLGVGSAFPPVPEPATMLICGVGLIGLGSLGRKKFYKRE